MPFDDSIIEDANHNPVGTVIYLCDSFISKYKKLEVDNFDQALLDAWENVLLIDAIARKNGLARAYDVPEYQDDGKKMYISLFEHISDIRKFYETVNKKKNIDKLAAQIDMRLNLAFAYEFSEGDLDRIQTLINELREHISGSNLFEQEHQQRLLKRLEKLQSEMHKKMPDLDRLWGLVGDAGVALGKFGTDAKPIVDRIKELTKITWNTQARKEELSSDTRNPMLEHDGE